MGNKYDVPLDLLKAVEGITNPVREIIKHVDTEDTIIDFREKDGSSNFYFKVLKNTKTQITSEVKYSYKWAPKDRTIITPQGDTGLIVDIITELKRWIVYIQEYKSTNSILDDNYTKAYTEHIYNENKFSDENADFMPFNPTEQEKLILLLDNFSEIIKADDSINETHKQKIDAEVYNIKQNLRTSTKNFVVKKVSAVFGFLYKIGWRIGKDLPKKGIDYLYKNFFEGVKDTFNGLNLEQYF